MCDRKPDYDGLEEATGFELKLYGKDGQILCNVGFFAADGGALSRVRAITLSAARTLAYMHLFCEDDGARRVFYAPHLRDFERKVRDFDYFADEER